MSDTTLQYKASLDGSGLASGAAQINSHLHQMGINTNTASANLGGLGTLLGTMANPLTLVALGITAIGGALVGSAQAAAAWETSMTGVAKTTGLAGPELEKLSQDLLQMSTAVPLAASELASIAAVGGSLGIAGDQLAGFTEVAAQMGVGFEMPADQAATAGAKILNAFGKEMSVDNLRSLGSVVNTMGDSFAATEPQVLEFLNRASFLNSTMGQSIPQVAALGTTLISTGLEAEVAATGIKSMLNMLTSETSKTGGMDNWAKLMGTSVDELKQNVATDLNSTLIETANKIAAIEDPVSRFQAAVQAAGSEGAPALLKLAGQQDNYTKALGMTNSEWEKASSLQKTFDAQAGTVNSQWTMFTNTLTMAATQLGTGMLPYLAEAIGFMTDLAKVGMKVAEVVGSWNLGEKIGNVVSNIPGVSALSEGAGSIWGDVKDWAGIGTEHAEQLAKEIEESDKLQKAGAEGLQAGIDAGVLKDPAKKAAQEFSKEFVAEFKAAQADREIAKILANAGKVSAQEVDESLRTFDYLGEQFALKITSHAGAAIGDWFSYSLKAGDTVLAQDLGTSGYIDPLAAFEMATGMPAPREGTEAYYRLLGDNIKAEQAKLQTQLKTFDYAGIAEPLKSRMENEGNVIAKTGSDTAISSYQKMLDMMKNPMIDELGAFFDEIAVSSKERPLAASEYQLFGENYKAQLYSSITELKPYLETLMKDLGSDAANAFSDNSFSNKEKEDLLGMKPWLDELKIKSPEEFAKAGGDSWIQFMQAIEDGASSSELYDLAKQLGLTMAGGVEDGLNLFGDKINPTKIAAQDLINTLTSGKVANFSKFALNVFQPEMMKEAQTYLTEWNTGVNLAMESAELYADQLAYTVVMNSELFTPEQITAAYDYKMQLYDAGKFLDIMGSKTEEAKTKLKEFKASTEDFGSVFANWQEGPDSGVFREGYIGASYGDNFDKYLQKKTNEVNQMKEAQERLNAASQGRYLESGYTDAAAQDQTKTIIWKIEGEQAMTFVDTMVEKVDHMVSILDPMSVTISANSTAMGSTQSSLAGSASMSVYLSPNSIFNAKREMNSLVNWIEALTPEIHARVIVDVNSQEVLNSVETAISRVLQGVRVR